MFAVTKISTLLRAVSVGAAIFMTAMSAQAQVGLQLLEAHGEFGVPAAVWYPSEQPSAPLDLGPYRLQAAMGAPIKAGKFPMILISHGSGGNEFGHADLAQYLAAHGYIVVAGRHWGDSYDQPQGRGSDTQTLGRPNQAVGLLDRMLGSGPWQDKIDSKRIGMAGFSAGGYTTLIMAGAKPNFELHGLHCQAHPEDRELCPAGKQTATIVNHPDWTLPVDHRVRAAVAMAPLSVMFDRQGLEHVSIPLRVYQAAHDEHLQNQWNTARLVHNLPASVEHAEVKGGHFIFIAPCTQALTAAVPEICVDAPGIDRLTTHQHVNAEILDFFNRTLNQ